MKIYSITEILEASNNILQRKKSNSDKKIKYNDFQVYKEKEPLILSNPVETNEKQSKNLNHEINEQEINEQEKKSNFNIEYNLKKTNKEIKDNNETKIINEIYKILKKK